LKARAALWAGLLLSAGNVFAGAGEDGFQFLKLGISPRQAAMGNTGVASADDANAASWNPAALGQIYVDELSFSYAPYNESSSLGEAAVAHPLRRGTLFGNVRALDYGETEGYDGGGMKTSSYRARDTAFSIGYGRPWSLSSSWGVAVKQVSESIAGESGGAVALDAGVYVRRPEGLLSYGASVRNVGGKASIGGGKVSLPRLLSGGAATHGFSDAWLVSLEATRSSDGRTVVGLGQEAWLYNAVAFRAGYESGREAGNGFSVGMGFKFHGARVDYAFTAGSSALGDTHRMGVTFRFGGAGDRSYQEALALMHKELYAEAILKLKEVLDADPGHKGAARALKDAVKSLAQEQSAPAEPAKNK
jgi:hypothetical protein